MSPRKAVVSQIRSNAKVISDPSRIANILNLHFSSVGNVYSNDSPYLKTYETNPIIPGSFNFTTILPTDILQVISELKERAIGPDGLDVKFIKLASNVLIYPLADLFNLSLSMCQLPSVWKSTKVTPLHKGGDPLDVNNYRPISIICSTAKIFEKIISKQLTQYVNNFNILSPVQSGFRSNFSTTTGLTKLTNDILFF